MDPLGELAIWIEDARAAGLAQPASVAFITASSDGRPSARTVSLKGIEAGELLFSSALWTRKVQEVEANPWVALLFHWPSLGRQVHITGRAEPGDDALADRLWDDRDRAHQLQTLVSRQGREISRPELERMREELARLAAAGRPSVRPDDWGAIRVIPDSIELWREAPDRLHERRLFAREGRGWTEHLLAP